MLLIEEPRKRYSRSINIKCNLNLDLSVAMGVSYDLLECYVQGDVWDRMYRLFCEIVRMEELGSIMADSRKT